VTRAAGEDLAPDTSADADVDFELPMDDVDSIAPAASAIPHDFAPAAPVPLPSSTALVVDASAWSAPAPLPHAPNEGGGWTFVVAPVASAALVVAWVLARRKHRQRP